MNSNKGKAVKAGIGYTIGNIALKGINFLTLPIFSRLLTTEEFGIYNVFLSYEAILYVLIGLAMHSSVRSAKLEFGDRIDEYISSITIIYIFNSIMCILLGFVFKGFLTSLLGFSVVEIIMLIIYSFSTAIIALYNNYLSLNYNYKKYILLSTLTSIGNVSLALLFIFTLFSDDKAFGRILAICIASIITTTIVICSIYRVEKPKVITKYWKYAINYSLPIVPHGISQVLLSQFDRIMIRRIDGNYNAGIFSFAGNLKLILIIITDSIGNAWTTWFYEQMNRQQLQAIKKRALQLMMAFFVITILLLAVSPELILLIGGPKYKESCYVAVPMIIDAFVLFIYMLIIPSEYFANKTKYIMFGTFFVAILNIITNYIFITTYGYIAAAYTTLFSYLCYLAVHIVISKKVTGFYVINPCTAFLSIIVITSLGFLFLFLIDLTILRLVIAVCITGIWILFGVKKDKELSEILKKLFAKIQRTK